MGDADLQTWNVTLHAPEESDLSFAGETRTIEVPADQSILSAARSAGLWLPADCQQGWCVTCAAKLLEGSVDHSNARRYYDVDEIAGFALLCIGKPRSDVTAVVDQYEAMLDHRASYDLPPGRAKRG